MYRQKEAQQRWRNVNPLGRHDALKHHFSSLNLPQPRVLERKLVYQYMVIFFNFSSTTSRELRQQFTACSGRI